MTHYKCNEDRWISGFLSVKGSESLGSKGMTPLHRKWRWFWWLTAGMVATFLAVAVAGWFREKHEVAVIRGRHQQYAADLKVRLSRVGDGIPLAEFKAHLPEAYNRESNSWEVSVPKGYNEELGCPNTFEELQFLVAEDGNVRFDDTSRAIRGKTICTFGSRGLWYYFKRAWHSGLLDPGVPPAP